MRTPKPGETWKFPNGETFIPGDGAWQSQTLGAWGINAMEWLARNGAIVPVEPEVYEGEAVCEIDGSWGIKPPISLLTVFAGVDFDTEEGDIVKWRIEVIRK